MRGGHQIEGLVATDLRRVEIERCREAEAAAAERPDADSRGDARAAHVELAPGGDPEQRRLEAGCVTRREELFGVRPGSAGAAHLCRHVEVEVEAAVARSSVTLA